MISMTDLDEALREHGLDGLAEIGESAHITLEPSGQINVIKKDRRTVAFRGKGGEKSSVVAVRTTQRAIAAKNFRSCRDAQPEPGANHRRVEAATIAARKPDQWAIKCVDETRSWKELHARTNRIARGLLANGVRHGDFLTIAPTTPSALWKRIRGMEDRRYPQPVSWRLPLAEMKAIADLLDGWPGLETTAGVPDRLGDPSLVDAAERRASAKVIVLDVRFHEPPASTSGGSTGRPKLIVAGAAGVVPDGGTVLWRIRPDDVVLMPGRSTTTVPSSRRFRH